MKRALIAVIAVTVVVLGLVGVGIYGQMRNHRRDADYQAAVDRVRAEHPLEMAASAVAATRRGGSMSHFSILPKTRPPGVTRLDPINDPADPGVTDVYSYGGGLQVMVTFTAHPAEHPCGGRPCARDIDLGFAVDNLRHVAVWVTGTPTSPEQGTDAQRFWSTTEWTSNTEDTWFAALADQGEIYGRR